ncbi:hypothetical protein I3760_04G124000 [Carya illinoinensis]|uniref:CAAX prenyl protease 2/Lysostaphin resistance protein A-like domain-containing protein n=1 Tax=Carya illinoinensis TaxID=32201 RepID=A0A922F888_CARIL|nr:hypothetical protein I3760_04G124000 [Carya illinoinensis]KAG6717898.1 hypothetical protein I3842_04G123400 [Carya illinoinensis]
MILLQCASVYLTPPKFSTESRKLPDSFLSPNSLLRSSVFKSNRSSKASFKRSCAQNEDAHGASIQGFSVLAGDIPWDRGSIWSTMAFYMFCLHIPLSFGGLSVVAAILHEPLLDPETEAVNNPIVKEILLSSDISRATCVLVYCIVTPLLEETVYRGFLLTSISSTMKWQKAIFVSSVIFSAAHFSGENFLQLSIIGCVLGCSYCWTGNLSSSIVIHSLYNALTLMLTLLS